MIVVDFTTLDLPTCSGALHIEAAELHADALRAQHETQLAAALLVVPRIFGFDVERLLELPRSPERSGLVWRLGLRRFESSARLDAAQAMVDSIRPAGPVRS